MHWYNMLQRRPYANVQAWNLAFFFTVVIYNRKIFTGRKYFGDGRFLNTFGTVGVGGEVFGRPDRGRTFLVWCQSYKTFFFFVNEQK
jgi:hypothetical protein